MYRAELPIAPHDAVVTVGCQKTGHRVDSIRVGTEPVTLDVSDRTGCIGAEQVGGDGQITELFRATGEGGGSNANKQQAAKFHVLLLVRRLKPARCCE